MLLKTLLFMSCDESSLDSAKILFDNELFRMGFFPETIRLGVLIGLRTIPLLEFYFVGSLIYKDVWTLWLDSF